MSSAPPRRFRNQPKCRRRPDPTPDCGACSVPPVRAFITGGHGFVGPWLRAHLEAEGDEVTAPPEGWEITDPAQVGAAIADAAPDAIYHLAAISNVVQSWNAPAHTFEVNALGTLH